MSRSYQEQVEVRLGEPALAGVRLERGWRRGVRPAGRTEGDGSGVGETEVEVPVAFLWRGRLLVVRTVLAQWSQRVPWWRSAPGGGPVEELEREVWLVEAGRGRAFSTGVYELSLSGCSWQLDRVSD